MFTRRIILSCAAVLPIAACTDTPAVSQLAADAQAIAAGLSATLPTLGGIIGIDAPTLSRLTAYISTVGVAATSIAAASIGFAPLSTVQILIGAVNAAVEIVTKPPVSTLIPPTIEAVFSAASSLLPVIEAAAGLSATVSAPPAMPADAARLILREAAGG